MKRFLFRLERVLQYREAIKEESRRELLAANALVREEQEKLNQLESAARATAVPDGIVPIEALTLVGYLATNLHRGIERQREQVAQAETKAEERRRIFVDAVKDFETLARLKTKRREEYNARIRKLEDQASDEIAVQRFTREILVRRKHEAEENGTHS